jgi:ParB-like nuclease domain/DNA methylase
MTNSIEPQLSVRERNSKCSLSLNIVYRRIDELKPDPANPRRHTKKQIRKIADSIRAFGFNVPVLIDLEKNVVAGHGRLLACDELGWTEVPTLCLDHLTPAQARAFRIADNRLTEISEWDDRLLAEELKELSLIGLDFNIEVTGFEMGEIDFRIASLEGLSEAEDPADAVPESPTLDRQAFATLFGDERAAMVFTDPPYNVPIDGHVSGLGAVHHRPFPMASGEMDSTQFTEFLKQAFDNLAAFTADGSIHFVCMDWRHIEELTAAGRGVYGELKNLCVWVKDNAGMGSLYRSQHELVFVFKHGRGGHRNNV